MEELIAIIIQAAIEILASGFGDLAVYSCEKSSDNKVSVFSLVVSGLIAGGLIGGASVFIFPNHIIQSGMTRILMLFLMPVLNGFISYQIASRVRRIRDISIWAHSGFAISFTFMMLAVRLAYIYNS